MKKLLIIIIPLVVLVLFCCLCIGIMIFAYSQGKGSGNVIEEEVAVTEFTKINLEGQGNLIVEQGDENSLTIEAEDNILERIQTEIADGELTIKYERKISFFFGDGLFPTEDINFYITVNDLESVTISGTGKLQSEYLDVDNLDIIINGAAEVDLEELYANKLDVQVSGAAELNLEGDVDVQSVKIDGAGQYNALDLLSEDCEIEVDGVGEVTVYVTQDLDITISGSGLVKYDGSPDNVKDDISGLGKVEEL